MVMKSFLLHALSPLHAGTGQAVGVIDLPIARMRSTGIPLLPGSSIKGVLRDLRTEPGVDLEALFAVFGPDHRNAGDHAGSLVISDARLFALPVRAFKGVFGLVSSPLLLELAARDLDKAPDIPDPAALSVLCASAINLHQTRVYFEELDFSGQVDAGASQWAAWLEASWGVPAYLAKRFSVVPDDVMAFLWETATQIDARNRINPDTRTVADGALWYEESLPPETLMVGLMSATRSRRKAKDLSAAEAMAFAMGADARPIVQFGGKATVGRGRCRMLFAKAKS